MAEDSSKNRLGRGLAALIGEMDQPEIGADGRSNYDGVVTQDQDVPIELIRANAQNPRRRFGDAELQDLSNSIKEHGIVQPILVRPCKNEDLGGARYEIIAGERRWRAAQRAGLHELPVVERAIGDQEALQLALVENLQREDLNPLEEAEAYQRLIADFHHRQEDVASALGKSRSHIANTIRLLNLPSSVRALIGDKSLTAGHARALLGASDPMTAARTVISKIGRASCRERV